MPKLAARSTGAPLADQVERSAFGNSGYIIPGGVGHTPYTLMRLADGKFLVGGFSWTEQTSTDYAAFRYNADGTLDTRRVLRVNS